MQPLLGDLARKDELGAVTDRPAQRIDDVRFGGPTGALADKPDQRCAVAVVGLEPTRAELAASGRRL